MPAIRQIFDETPSPHSAELLWRDEMPAMILEGHDQRDPAPPVNLIELQGVRFGGRGLFANDAGLVHEAGIAPEYLEYLLGFLPADSPVVTKWTEGLFAEERTVVALDAPALVPIHPNWVFGHFLLEMMPRALLLDQTCPPDWPMLISRSAPPWLNELFRKAVPRRPFHYYNHETEVVTAPRFVGCSDLVSETIIRPEARVLIQMLKARLLVGQNSAGGPTRSPASEKVFISRKAITKTRRKVENQDDIETAMAAKGYLVLRPETLSFEDQVGVFGNAKIVVGEFSSAMHNAIFSPPGTRIICLNWLNSYQSQIANLFGHTVGYIPPDGGEFRAAISVRGRGLTMRFDPVRLTEKLARVENTM